MLEVSNLNSHYGMSHVLTGVNLLLRDGELVSILGRNGSGRSTLLKTIIGIVPPSKGSICLDGVDVTGWPSHKIARAGIAYVPEDRLMFNNLTVEENLRAGEQTHAQERVHWTIQQMYELFPSLRNRRNVSAGYLSGGEQQMLTICRSLLGNPKVIMIDEPTEGLAPLVIESLMNFIQKVYKSGVGVILVEQKMTIALRLAKRILIMGHGQIVFDGSTEEMKRDQSIQKQWLEVG